MRFVLSNQYRTKAFVSSFAERGYASESAMPRALERALNSSSEALASVSSALIFVSQDRAIKTANGSRGRSPAGWSLSLPLEPAVCAYVVFTIVVLSWVVVVRNVLKN
jgi:hypothetical protein